MFFPVLSFPFAFSSVCGGGRIRTSFYNDALDAKTEIEISRSKPLTRFSPAYRRASKF